MPRPYSVDFLDTNTVTTTQGGLTSAATIRPAIYDLTLGSEAAPVDQAARYNLERYTAAGTSTAVVPQALDPGDPASLAAAGENHSVEPTYTAAAILLSFPLHQRATYRWVANGPGREIKLPATAANGVGLITRSVSSAFVITCTMHFEE